MGATGNATYTTANGAAYAIEKVIRTDFKSLWDHAHPLLAKLQTGANFNKGGQIKGLTLILPVQFDDMATPVDGSAANNFTALTPAANQGDTQASYIFTRYHGAFWIDPDEMKLLMNGERGNFLGARKKQIMQSYRKAASGDIAAAALSARANLLGLRYLLSTSNSPGGISQGGSNTYWDAVVSTTGGTFAISDVDNAMDTINRKGRSKVDLLLLSNNATVNIFGKVRDNVANLQRITNGDTTAKFGFSDFIYRDADCALDPDLGDALSTTGGFMALSTDSFYWMGDPMNMSVKVRDLQGTGAVEYYYEAWVCLANDDPGVNAFYSAYTA